MYTNGYSYVRDVEVLTKENLDAWYNKHVDNTVEDICLVSDFSYECRSILLLDSTYVIPSGGLIFNVDIDTMSVVYMSQELSSRAYGVRILVSLKSDIQVKEVGESDEGEKIWDIVDEYR